MSTNILTQTNTQIIALNMTPMTDFLQYLESEYSVQALTFVSDEARMPQRSSTRSSSKKQESRSLLQRVHARWDDDLSSSCKKLPNIPERTTGTPQPDDLNRSDTSKSVGNAGDEKLDKLHHSYTSMSVDIEKYDGDLVNILSAAARGRTGMPQPQDDPRRRKWSGNCAA
jgi:hypothetical protein